jgi:hypothetical protein
VLNEAQTGSYCYWYLALSHLAVCSPNSTPRDLVVQRLNAALTAVTEGTGAPCATAAVSLLQCIEIVPTFLLLRN